ncbi:phage tail tape measure protein lambda [Mycolicibacterium novocastrense]|uniref:Phage tail tape measure protein lambda n=1 Tax=Mycolicibacterium novocastrense TaxID=59813 RepID=A0ABQ0KMV2_MYCNV|nr:phage tail tape measure protein lambda [Mycolicibacterium novocastrense]
MGGRIERGRVSVGFGERLGERPLGLPGRFVEHLPHRIAVEFAELAGRERFVETQYLEEIEYEIPHIASVVAHDERLSFAWGRA